MHPDEEHLQILSAFHYIVGAIVALFSCFALIYVAIGISAFNHGNASGPPLFVGGIFLAIGGVLLIVGWVYAACLLATGRFLTQRRAYTFCFVISLFSCLFAPFGTILGIFTILVLVKPSVKMQFGN